MTGGKIRGLLDGLREEPKRAEADWQEVTFGARDVGLSRYLIGVKKALFFRCLTLGNCI